MSVMLCNVYIMFVVNVKKSQKLFGCGDRCGDRCGDIN